MPQKIKTAQNDFVAVVANAIQKAKPFVPKVKEGEVPELEYRDHSTAHTTPVRMDAPYRLAYALKNQK